MADKRQILQRSYPDNLEETGLPESIHPVLRRVYAARGVNASTFGTALSSLLPVSKLEGTEEAAERMTAAFAQRERVLVVGDFDADGATATALMITCLRAFGFSEPGYAVPDRQKFGYGLTAGIVDFVAPRKPDLIVTVLIIPFISLLLENL